MILFLNKEDFKNFNHEYFIKIDLDKLLSGITWHYTDNEFIDMDNNHKLNMKISIIISIMKSLKSKFIVFNEDINTILEEYKKSIIEDISHITTKFNDLNIYSVSQIESNFPNVKKISLNEIGKIMQRHL